MSTRNSIFYAPGLQRADGLGVSVHLFREAWFGRTYFEVTTLDGSAFGETNGAEHLIDSVTLFALAKKVAAAERAEAFARRFGFGLWQYDFPEAR